MLRRVLGVTWKRTTSRLISRIVLDFEERVVKEGSGDFEERASIALLLRACSSFPFSVFRPAKAVLSLQADSFNMRLSFR